MTVPWRTYQQEVATLFQSLGCTVEIEKEVAGARGIHLVDVLAKISVAGVNVTWVVECKLWGTAIPKEKVLALGQVAADIGADRAFLLFESGFQAGAMRAAQNTNITLTSSQELLESARTEIDGRQLTALSERAHRLQRALHDIFILDDGSPSPLPGATRDSVVELLSNVFELKSIALPKALAGDFPITLTFDGSRAVYGDATAVICAAARELDRVASQVSAVETEVEHVRSLARQKLAELVRAVNEFLDASEAVRLSAGKESVDEALLACALRYMKLIGTRADALRAVVSGRTLGALSEMMRALIDGPYILLGSGKCEPAEWRDSRTSVEVFLRSLSTMPCKPASDCQ